MTQLLMLDAAFPPDPGSLIADITTVGAQGAFLYVWGPFVNGTPGHVLALQRAGLVVAPIVVPGNVPVSPDAILPTVEAWGFPGGPVFFDFERGSDPGKAWFDSAEQFFQLYGYHAEPYGTLSVLGQYDPDDKDWVANWLRTGILDPVPQLPPDWEAWQFVNDIMINGHQYDASVVSESIMFGGTDLTPDQAQTLSDVNQRTALLYNLLVFGTTGNLPDGTSPPLQFGAELAAIQQVVKDIDAKLAAASPGTGLTPDQASNLSHVAAAIVRIETALSAA